MFGYTDDERKKAERKEAERQTMTLTENAKGDPKKVSIKPPERKVAMEDKDDSMTFGNFFRILLIAAIIIVLIVVIGSQALKIVKSQEK
ncbi:MAG: hypothetical protein EOO18_13345 [Chryseobacterium sp.]|nr:MAG: hypothetical protein EOO18_13345 [Chryseobacterium sp.]